MFRNRLFMVMVIFLMVFAALTGRMFYYQIWQGPAIARQAAAMRSRNIPLREYPRADILDRNLLPLTNSTTSWSLFFVPDLINAQFAHQSGRTLESDEYILSLARFLSPILARDNLSLYRMIAAAREKKVQSTVLAVHLDPEQIRRINSAHIAGLIIAPVSNRYQENGFGIHVLGYVNQDGSTGLTGVEKEYNRFLTRGHKYQELASILDGRGQVIPGLGSRLRNPLSDQQGSVVLTIDKRLQEIVEKAMDKGVKKGAVVVLDTRSKEILAMASRPAFNPYKLDDIINYDQDSCLVNRALSAYNPGSLFKIVVASAALQEGLVGMDEQFNCSGRYIFNDQVSIACWQEKGHGKLSFASAFANSCNPTFIQVGLRLGRARLLHYVQKLHLTDTGISGFGSRNGDSYVKINGGDPAMGNACLGQEGVMLTPLQLASLVSTVADGGFWSVPALVRCTLDEKSHRQPISRPKPQRVLDSSVAALVRSLMEKVIVDGTGKSASLQEVQVAGKTATSQTGQITNGEEEILNTWFAGYFPADNPRWTVVVLVEKGKSGAASSAPVFREIARGILQYNSVTENE